MNPFLPGGTVNTSGTWTLIRDWVRECESRHPICRQLKVRSRSLPTRLLKLPDGTYDRVSVVRTEGLPVDTKYITLSHRWGNAEFHAFVKSRPASYFENIDVAELPPIFRDILLVARQLEVSFIWIDAFCILQGSEEDWIRESARMGDVYRYSWCNIAASRAASSDESIFATRDSRAAKPCIVQTPWDPQASGAGKRWLAFDHNYLWEDNVERAPLAERAWVVQELALASRVVYFGCSQVFWECTQLRACETCPSGVPIVATKKLSLHPSCLQFEGLRVFDPADYRLHIWSLLISKYSACLLTETAKDKLVALSGLAKSLGPSHEYCAGLWRKDLAYQLLWKSLRPSTSRRAPVTPAEYQAPSWSWASVNGPISYRIRESVNDPEAEILITVLDVETEKAGSDPTGRVKGGSIVISGPIVKASLGVRQVGTINYHVVNGALGKGIIDGDPLPDTNEHYCMPVEVKTRKGEGHTLVVGLILTRSVVNANALQRMAYFTLSDHEDRKNEGETMFGFWKSFRDPARRPDEALARESRTPRTAAAVVFGLPIYEFTIV